jgi:hypothetical protein
LSTRPIVVRLTVTPVYRRAVSMRDSVRLTVEAEHPNALAIFLPLRP